MKPFPILNENEVVIVCVDTYTGKVLNDEFKYAINDEQEVYKICESFDEAVELAKSIMKERKNVECVIHGNDKQVLKHLSPFQKE